MIERKCVTIENLIVIACHGCNPEEKVQPQPFRFDIKAFINCEDSCFNDDLNSTVSYSAIGKMVVDFCTNTCFNLLEKLANETCRLLMDEFPMIDEIQIELKKTQPPTRLHLSSLGVSFTLKREIVYLSLGSSLGDKEKFLNDAINQLKLVRGVNVLQVAKFITTEPYGDAAHNLFINTAVKVSTYLEPEEFFKFTHAIEIFEGRTRGEKWGEDRTLDIDIVFWGRKKILTENLRIPHYDWKNRDFMKIPIAELDPFILEGWD
jgi:dihydroneopterin aldolase/2-amino-4-hydroxy-6-hydroxymethyldihydropteridine diphosphokinase